MSSLTYIVGPCAAESREQVMATADQLSAVCIQHSDCRFIFRAGAWKPRTSPKSFQGAGIEALQWLQEVRDRFGMEVATEVATPEHAEQALKAGIDYLWIGARSSATPIVVQSLADSICDLKLKIEDFRLKGIFIKNPVNADAELWLGNIERLEKTGVPVMAIHRGCNHRPCWELAHKVRMARPDIPMLLDPSHMSGDASKVPALLSKVEELGLNGAMIEVHCCPEKALSDNNQQITPTILRDYLDSIPCRFRLESVFSTSNLQKEDVELNWLRAEIDEIDEALWDTIAQRMDVSARIGAWKKAHGVAPLQPERYKEIVERIQHTDNGLQTDFALRLYDLIHEESLRQQR